MTNVRTDVIDRIRKLLKLAEGTTNEAGRGQGALR